MERGSVVKKYLRDREISFRSMTSMLSISAAIISFGSANGGGTRDIAAATFCLLLRLFDGLFLVITLLWAKGKCSFF